jgi:hypothetical protein
MVKIVKHQFINNNFSNPNWKIKHLFLGTFNPEGGEKVNYYYGRDRNQTWKLLSEIFKVDFNVNHENFLNEIKRNEIACMDMINSVTIKSDDLDYVLGKGYSDSKIINGKVNREYNTVLIKEIIENNPGIKIYSTWGGGSNLADWVTEINKIPNIIKLVSPSMVARVPKGIEKYVFMKTDWESKISNNK